MRDPVVEMFERIDQGMSRKDLCKSIRRQGGCLEKVGGRKVRGERYFLATQLLYSGEQEIVRFKADVELSNVKNHKEEGPTITDLGAGKR